MFYLNNYTSTAGLVAAVSKIRNGGYPPNLPAALATVRSDVFAPSNGARQEPSVLQLAVVFVTETLSRYRSSTLDEAWAASEMGIGIVTVGIGTFLDRQLLASITSYPSDKNLFIVLSVRNVSALVYPIKRIICSGTAQTYTRCCGTHCGWVIVFGHAFTEPEARSHTKSCTTKDQKVRRVLAIALVTQSRERQLIGMSYCAVSYCRCYDKLYYPCLCPS